jgi:nucleoid-associated protein YgaU
MSQRSGRARTIQPLLALLTAATAPVAVLLATRPALAPAPASWTGDDLAVALLWWGAVIASVWLAVTTLACVAALARGRTRSAHDIARLAPPIARRVLQAALVSTWALVPTAAYATPSSAPITVHADARGRLTTEPRRPRPTPARASASTSTSTTTAATTTTAPPVVSHREPSGAAVAPTKRAPSPSPPPTPTPAPTPTTARATAPAVGVRIHVVVSGDNLWQIARTEVARMSGSERVSDAQIAPYWQRVIAANRATLRSGDPSLIFPGEVVALP